MTGYYLFWSPHCLHLLCTWLKFNSYTETILLCWFFVLDIFLSTLVVLWSSNTNQTTSLEMKNCERTNRNLKWLYLLKMQAKAQNKDKPDTHKETMIRFRISAVGYLFINLFIYIINARERDGYKPLIRGSLPVA